MSLNAIGVMLCLLEIVFGDRKRGPYQIDLVEAGVCRTEEFGPFGDDLTSNGKQFHMPGCKYLYHTGNITLKNGVGLKGASELTTYISKWDPVSGWRKNYFIMRNGDLCKWLDLYYPILTVHMMGYIRNHTDIPVRCPIHDGTYQIRNLSLHEGKVPFMETLEYGQYLLHSTVRNPKKPQEKKPRACARFHMKISEATSTSWRKHGC